MITIFHSYREHYPLRSLYSVIAKWLADSRKSSFYTHQEYYAQRTEEIKNQFYHYSSPLHS